MIWYRIQSRETGDMIRDCESFSEAQDIVDKFEEQDMLEEIYEPNFYEIVEVDDYAEMKGE